MSEQAGGPSSASTDDLQRRLRNELECSVEATAHTLVDRLLVELAVREVRRRRRTTAAPAREDERREAANRAAFAARRAGAQVVVVLSHNGVRGGILTALHMESSSIWRTGSTRPSST